MVRLHITSCKHKLSRKSLIDAWSWYTKCVKIIKNQDLSLLTSFQTGGPAETFIVIEQTNDLREVLTDYKKPLWLLGSGANTLISDHGLPGTTLQFRNDKIEISEEADGALCIADAGVDWDAFVQATIAHGLWGLEFTSGIPGTVGAAVVGNIAAYGQAVSDRLAWVEVVSTTGDPTITECLKTPELGLKYRYSDFQNAKLGDRVIVRAAFQLSTKPTGDLAYASAQKAASDLGLSTDTLAHRRTIIMEARKRAGSLIEPGNTHKTAGSFFRNPHVSKAQAEQIIAHEENNISMEQIMGQNSAHSGDAYRVSAAHVLLAAGFKRGQAWGPVRLHPDHILKLENTGGATSQQIYDVAQEIIGTVKEKLHIDLEAEVRFLGEF